MSKSETKLNASTFTDVYHVTSFSLSMATSHPFSCTFCKKWIVVSALLVSISYSRCGLVDSLLEAQLTISIPDINTQNLLIVLHTVSIDLSWRIRWKIKKLLFGDHFLQSHDLCTWSCDDAVRRNYIVVKVRVNFVVQWGTMRHVGLWVRKRKPVTFRILTSQWLVASADNKCTWGRLNWKYKEATERKASWR